MRALRTAATGMAAQQLNVEVISNNIANMNTVGFKRQRAELQDLLYQNVQRMGAPSSGAGTVVLHDLPPYVMASGNSAAAHGLNTEGLRRRGFSDASIVALRRAYKIVYKNGLTLADARTALAAEIANAGEAADALRVLEGFLAQVTRGIVR